MGIGNKVWVKISACGESIGKFREEGKVSMSGRESDDGSAHSAMVLPLS